MMSNSNEVKDVRVICADGTYDLYGPLLKSWKLAEVINISGRARDINGGWREPTIQEAIASGIFAKSPHAFLTVIKNIGHLGELLEMPYESRGKVVAIVADYASELSQANHKILQAGAHPVMTTDLERVAHNAFRPENNILLRAILEASK